MRVSEERVYGKKYVADVTADIADEYAAVVDNYRAMAKGRYGQYRIGVVTALTKETAAVHAALGEGEEFYHEFADAPYTVFDVPAAQAETRHKIVVVQAPKMGNSSSAIAAATLIKDFRALEDIVMVGIAGGIPDPDDPEWDVRVGDIVVSHGRGLVQYDMNKVEDARDINRSVHAPPSAFMTGRVSKLEVDRKRTGATPWVEHLEHSCAIEDGARPADEADVMSGKRNYGDDKDSRRKPSLPVVHLGVVASANSLLKSAGKRDKLRSDFKALAVEMEGSGLGDAAWFAGVGYLIVRGICDYCDPDKNDLWQGYAAAAAAAYLRALLEVTPHRRRD